MFELEYGYSFVDEKYQHDRGITKGARNERKKERKKKMRENILAKVCQSETRIWNCKRVDAWPFGSEIFFVYPTQLDLNANILALFLSFYSSKKKKKKKKKKKTRKKKKERIKKKKKSRHRLCQTRGGLQIAISPGNICFQIDFLTAARTGIFGRSDRGDTGLCIETNHSRLVIAEIEFQRSSIREILYFRRESSILGYSSGKTRRLLRRKRKYQLNTRD